MEKEVVAPFIGAWIETIHQKEDYESNLYYRCSLYGSMDWNDLLGDSGLPNLEVVAPFMGAWIETIPLGISVGILGVAPFMGAWIET